MSKMLMFALVEPWQSSLFAGATATAARPARGFRSLDGAEYADNDSNKDYDFHGSKSS